MYNTIVFYKDEDFTFSFFYQNNTALLHCEVEKWNTKVLRKMYEVFGVFREFCKRDGIEKIGTVTPNPKFAKLFGAKALGKSSFLGKEYEVMQWD